ncbi:Fibropellin-1 like [Melia azedarach]|uniref:Fibropellin-1 like n=1 Tax=Melia azedarach TaxID=155640 RepID=A0ACC1YA10_MELAZ|nr:Fibropellin-1 like [Melia azedarach]
MVKPQGFQLLLLLLLVVAVSQCSCRSVVVKAIRPTILNHRLGYSKTFAAQLGVVCKCCDGEKGECRSTWQGSCSNLQCLPWKFH